MFNGESGYLDHALASPSLAAQATGTADWHINPDEPTVLDYNVEFKTPNQVTTFYDPGPYRASDHDPVVIGLDLAAPPTVDAGGPYAVDEGGSVSVSASGTIRWRDSDLRLGPRRRRHVRDARADGDLLGGGPRGPGHPHDRGPGERPGRTTATDEATVNVDLGASSGIRPIVDAAAR